MEFLLIPALAVQSPKRKIQIHHLFRMITYVSKNEQTSCVKLVHLYERIEDIPSEIEANSKCKHLFVN